MLVSRIRKIVDSSTSYRFRYGSPRISGSNIIFKEHSADYSSESLHVYRNGFNPELYPLASYNSNGSEPWVSGNSVAWSDTYGNHWKHDGNQVTLLSIPSRSYYQPNSLIGIWGKSYAWIENFYRSTGTPYGQEFIQSRIHIDSGNAKDTVLLEVEPEINGIFDYSGKAVTWVGQRALPDPLKYTLGEEDWYLTHDEAVYTLNTSSRSVLKLTSRNEFSTTGTYGIPRDVATSGVNSAWMESVWSLTHQYPDNIYFYNGITNTKTLIASGQVNHLEFEGDNIIWIQDNLASDSEQPQALHLYNIKSGRNFELDSPLISNFDISGNNIVWSSYDGIYFGKITDDYTFDIETPDIVSGGEMDNGQPPGVHPFVRNIKFDLIGDPELKDQWEPRRTWVIIHGWNSDSSEFQKLANTLKQAAPNDIVLTLDWREAAGSSYGYRLPNGLLQSNGSAATWIRPVAEVAAQLLKDWGLTEGKYLNIIGHSLGSLLSSEIAAQFVYENHGNVEVNQQNLGVDTITALDPPSDSNLFNPTNYDLDGRIPGTQLLRQFNQVSRFSRSFVGNHSISGNKEFSSWADESIIMDFGELGLITDPPKSLFGFDTEHQYVVKAFESLIDISSETKLINSLFNSESYSEPYDFKKDGFQEEHEGILKIDTKTFLPIEFRAKKLKSSNPFVEPEIVYGTSKDDTLFGTNNLTIPGRDGDSIFGGDGDDILYGSSLLSLFESGSDNNDTLNGGAGNDTLLGQGGDDILEGGEGNDILQDGFGKDFLDGGNGNDVLDTSGSSIRDYDYLNGREENDPLLSGTGNNPLLSGIGNNPLLGNIGNNPLLGDAEDGQLTGKEKSNLDSNNSLFGGDDYLNGGAGNDTLRSGIGNDALNGGTGEDLLFGGSGDDQLNGDEGDDALYGESGNDGLIGNLGNDSLFGGDGDDNLYGNAGNDFLNGGLGKDYISGGEGNDVIRGDSDDVISITDSDSVSKNAPSLKANTPITEEINNVNGDILDGGIGNDYLTGSSGNDSLIGGIGIDSLFGGYGNDTLYANYAEGVVEDSLDLKEKNREVLDGGAGDDYLLGSLGKDFLIGGAGNDYLLGGLGQDSLIGGAGDDTLIGGRGADSFVFENQVTKFDLGHDTVKQFRGGQGDKIVLSKSTFSKLGSKPGSGFKIKSEFATISTKNTRKSFSAAEFSSALIVYNSSTGQLFYNPNGIGNGFGKGGLFATIQGNLKADDFRIRNSLL